MKQTTCTNMDVRNILYGFLTRPHMTPSIQTVHISTSDLDGYACTAMSDVYEQIFNQGVYNPANQIQRYHISKNADKALATICRIVRTLSHSHRTINLLITGIDKLDIGDLIDTLDCDEDLTRAVDLRIVFIGHDEYSPASIANTQFAFSTYRSIYSNVRAIRCAGLWLSVTKYFTELLADMATAMFLSPANSKKKSKGTKFNRPLATALVDSVLNRVRNDDAELWRRSGGMNHSYQKTICEAASSEDYGTRNVFEDPRKLDLLFQMCCNQLDSDPYHTFATLVSRIVLNHSVLPAQYLIGIDRRLTEIAEGYAVFKNNVKECYCTALDEHGKFGTIWQCMLSDLPPELKHMHLNMEISNPDELTLKHAEHRYCLITPNTIAGPAWDARTRELYCKYYMNNMGASEDQKNDCLDGYMFFINLQNHEAPDVELYRCSGYEEDLPDIVDMYLTEDLEVEENEDTEEECEETSEDCDTACCDSKPQDDVSLSQLADAMSEMLKRRFQSPFHDSANEPDQVDQTEESPAEQPDTTETEECADTACTPPEEDEPVPDPEPTATDEAPAE